MKIYKNFKNPEYKLEEILKQNLYKIIELSLNEKSRVLKLIQKNYLTEKDRKKLTSILKNLSQNELELLFKITIDSIPDEKGTGERRNTYKISPKKKIWIVSWLKFIPKGSRGYASIKLFSDLQITIQKQSQKLARLFPDRVKRFKLPHLKEITGISDQILT